MNKTVCLLFYSLILFSCGGGQKVSNDMYSLQPTDSYLKFSIDRKTRFPRFCLWTFEEKGKEYMCFPNEGREILFYNIENQQLVKKVEYEAEGDNGVGTVYSFYATDFNHIYIPDLSSPALFVTDSTGHVLSKIEYNQTDDGIPLMPTFAHTITYSPICFLGDSIYLPQETNGQFGDHFVSKSPFGVMIDRATGRIKVTPLKYSLSIGDERDIPYSTGGGKLSVCYDGKNFVYSEELKDSIICLSRDFSKITKHLAKSRFIKHAKVEVLPSDVNLDQLIKRKCELPSYGNLIYDKYREMYYRFAFPEVKMDKERSFMDIYHNGRKQFSIIIMDKDMNVVGEKLFPEYQYNAYLLFIRKDGLYISVSHFKRPDFDENVLCFQKIELVKL
ncbi:DUF4221 family protein [uncultured Bacteroides sp.]|uniref:DUF4221 family protein n=1 Tax=uncultured Bacteroides sp. TaxID=162156 RepID=UPI002AAC2F4A|nr:DUF4221 family protein [uncultured Bacteroides sp.]